MKKTPIDLKALFEQKPKHTLFATRIRSDILKDARRIAKKLQVSFRQYIETAIDMFNKNDK